MQSSKLHYYLSRLSPTEWKGLLEFARSPACNQDALLLRFLELYGPHLPKAPEKEAFYHQLFPDRPYNSGHLRGLMTKVLELFQEYISYVRFREEKVLRKTLFLKELNRRRWPAYFLKTHTLLMQELRKSAPSDEYYFWRRIELDGEKVDFLSRQPRKSGDRGLQDFINTLDNYYLITKLTLACLALNQSLVIPTEFEREGVEKLVESLEKRGDTPTVLTRIYFHIYQTLTAEPEVADTHFVPLKDLLLAHSGDYGRNEVLGLFIFTINFCNRRIRAGQRKYQAEAVELYQHLLAEEIILEQGRITPFFYKNIIRLFGEMGGKTGDFQWVETFCQTYRERLTGEEAHKYPAFGQAVLHFYRGNFAEATILFRRIHATFEDVFFRLDARSFLLMSTFELEMLGEADEGFPFDKEWNAFRMFLDRNRELPTARKKGYKAFSDAIRTLMTASGKPYREMEKRLSVLRETLQANLAVPHKQWLLTVIARELGD